MLVFVSYLILEYINMYFSMACKVCCLYLLSVGELLFRCQHKI